MPRVARRGLKSCYYHVMVQGINREYIFEKEENICKYLEIILKKLNDSCINILAYCIMNNHAHFLIYSDNQEDLSKFMQKINISYSKFYNMLNNRVGYVFRDRYRSEIISSKNQLFSCLCYIHNNPVKAGIVKKASEYKYSSFNEFLGQKKILNSKSLNLIFGNSNNLKNQFIMIHNNYSNVNPNFLDEKEKSIYEFLNEIEQKYNKKIYELKEEKLLLKSIIIQARKDTDVTITELAKVFGISKSSVSRYCSIK